MWLLDVWQDFFVLRFFAPDGDGGGDPGANLYPDGGEPDGEPAGEPKDGEPAGEPKDGEPDGGEPKDGEPDGGKPGDGEPDEGEPKDGEPKDGEPEVPEKYEFKLPEGWEMEEELLNNFSEYAKGLKLSQDQAQQLIDMAVEHAEVVAEDSLKAIFPPGDTETEAVYLERLNGILNRLGRESFQKVRESDPEIGGEKWDEAVARANLLLAKYATPQLRQDLKESIFGDHPELIRLLSKLHKDFAGEDKVLDGKGLTGTPSFESKEDRWANSLYKKKGQ